MLLSQPNLNLKMTLTWLNWWPKIFADKKSIVTKNILSKIFLDQNLTNKYGKRSLTNKLSNIITSWVAHYCYKLATNSTTALPLQKTRQKNGLWLQHNWTPFSSPLIKSYFGHKFPLHQGVQNNWKKHETKMSKPAMEISPIIWPLSSKYCHSPNSKSSQPQLSWVLRENGFANHPTTTTTTTTPP